MNTDQIAGRWKQLRGLAKQKWGKLTDDDLNEIKGNRDLLAGKIQARYGDSKEEAQRKADEFLRSLDEAVHTGSHKL